MRESDVLRSEMEMSQAWSVFAAVLGRQKPPNRRAFAAFEGKSASERISSRQNIFGIEPTAKTKFYGQMTKSRSLRARDAAALVQPSPVAPGTRAAATRCFAPEARDGTW